MTLRKLAYALSSPLECSKKAKNYCDCIVILMAGRMVGFMSASLKPGISFKNVSVSYKKHAALENISLELPAGTLTAILGPNGGGKSSFLKAILGLVSLRTGQIQRFHFKPKDIAYLPQQTEIDRTFPLTVRDVVALGLCQMKGFFQDIEKETEASVQKALEKVGLVGASDRSLHMLSGGQFQRVLFARVSLQNAKIILLDEPFAAVDSYTLEELIQIVKRWSEEGRTVIVVTHDLELVRTYFPYSLLLARRIIAYGATDKVLTLKNLREAKKRSCHWQDDSGIEERQTMQIFKP